jgi:uncharacterized protein YjbI with pentapeptide repeats
VGIRSANLDPAVILKPPTPRGGSANCPTRNELPEGNAMAEEADLKRLREGALDLSHCNFNGADLSGLDLSGVISVRLHSTTPKPFAPILQERR